MVSEATMIAIDNSEYMRNEDYITSRYEAQLSTCEYIFRKKVNANPENTVGLLAYGGNGPEVLSTLTTDYGKILSGAHDTKIHGGNHFSSGIQVAALALKHRQNKVQSQRIVIFVGSPVNETEKELEKLAKKMKKNNIAIDIINFGEESVNTSKLEKFNSIINNHENSHLVTVPPGPRALFEVIANSPILMEGGFDGDDSGMGMGFDGFGGAAGDGDLIDPDMDPDLALALRLSLEEEKARQEREKQEKEKEQEKSDLLKIDETKEPENDKDNDKDTPMVDADK